MSGRVGRAALLGRYGPRLLVDGCPGLHAEATRTRHIVAAIVRQLAVCSRTQQAPNHLRPVR